MEPETLSVKKLLKESLQSSLNSLAELVSAVADSGEERNPNDEERVHHLRTQTRRIDVGLDLFQSWLPTSRTDWISKKIKRLHKRAGVVRNFDILLRQLESQTVESVPPKISNWLVERAFRSRRKAWKQLRRSCDRLLKVHFAHKVRRLKHHFGWTHSSAAPSLQDLCQRTVERKSTVFLSALAEARCDNSRLHPARIAGRNLRYALESLHPALMASSADVVIVELSRVQDELGKANDQKFTLEFLRESLAKCHRNSIVEQLPEIIAAIEATAQEQARIAIVSTGEIVDRIIPLLQRVAVDSDPKLS